MEMRFLSPPAKYCNICASDIEEQPYFVVLSGEYKGLALCATCEKIARIEA